jgi:hypothetical protein
VSYRTLVWLPIAVALAFLGAELALGPSAQAFAVTLEVELAKVVWLAGALAAARVFESGDYLRRGWLIVAASVVLFLLRDVTRIPAVEAALSPLGVGIARGALVVAGNAGQVAGIWVLARVWSAAGLDDAVRGQKRALFAATIALVAVLTGPSITHDAALTFTGHLDAVPHLASDLGDAAIFVLLAALVRTALALRGGVVFWTWSLLATGQVAWVLFDGARTLAEHLGSTSPSSPAVESLRVVGAIYFAAAGVAQRWIVSARFPVDAAGPVGVLEDGGRPA